MSATAADLHPYRVVSFWQSTNGKKVVMALTGVMMFLFVIGHLLGNLLVFAGRAQINAYAQFLHFDDSLLWIVRSILIIAVILHVVVTIQLALRNKKARPIGYLRKEAINSSYASRTMYWSGPIVLAFIIFHLLQFTAGYIHPETRFIPKRCLSQSGDGLSGLVGLGVVCLRHLPPGPPSAPWPMEHAAIGWASPFASQGAGTQTGGVDHRRSHCSGIYIHPDQHSAGVPKMMLNPNIPSGPIEQAWDKACFDMKLVSPANKRRHSLIVVGSGLAGASASASLGELGYNVKCFCFQDSPRRAHSIAAQGGINAAKNYPNDGDSIYRLFYDTLKGGDFRAREANVYRLAQISVNIIDQCVAQGVPFAREYGGSLANRSFGGAQVSRTFYARGQTGQQLLLGAYQALERQVYAGTVSMIPRTEMLDLIVIAGQARGIVARNLVSGELSVHIADAVILASGGYGNVYYLSTNAKGSNATAIWRAYKRGALFANPCFTQIHPTCIPVSGDYQSKLTLMSESLRNDGRIWVPKMKGDRRSPNQIPEDERDYYLERRYPSFGNLVPRDVASRNAKAGL